MSDRYKAIDAWVEKWQIKDGYKAGNLPYSTGNGTVGLGWLPLLEDLVAKLVALGWNRRLDQIKEKFGGLRFYISDRFDIPDTVLTQLDDCIIEAEEKSYTICENCGAEGTPRKSSWIRTLCDACNDSRYTSSPWHNI